MAPTSPHMGAVATHIATSLKTPDIVFVQEIQDNSGPTDDGTVIANLTLSNLVAAIANASNGVVYDFLEIAPVNDQDGGQPGGNIRQAYLCVHFSNRPIAVSRILNPQQVSPREIESCPWIPCWWFLRCSGGNHC